MSPGCEGAAWTGPTQASAAILCLPALLTPRPPTQVSGGSHKRAHRPGREARCWKALLSQPMCTLVSPSPAPSLLGPARREHCKEPGIQKTEKGCVPPQHTGLQFPAPPDGLMPRPSRLAQVAGLTPPRLSSCSAPEFRACSLCRDPVPALGALLQHPEVPAPADRCPLLRDPTSRGLGSGNLDFVPRLP